MFQGKVTVKIRQTGEPSPYFHEKMPPKMGAFYPAI